MISKAVNYRTKVLISEMTKPISISECWNSSSVVRFQAEIPIKLELLQMLNTKFRPKPRLTIRKSSLQIIKKQLSCPRTPSTTIGQRTLTSDITSSKNPLS